MPMFFSKNFNKMEQNKELYRLNKHKARNLILQLFAFT